MENNRTPDEAAAKTRELAVEEKPEKSCFVRSLEQLCAADIAENGICMTGGGAMLYGLDRLLAERCKIPCYVADDAVSCVAIGAGKALEHIDLYAGNSVYDYKSGDYYDNY